MAIPVLHVMGKENAAVVFGGRIAIGIGLQRAFFIADMGEDALFYHKVPVSRRRRFAEDMCIRKKGVVEEEIAAEAARLAMHHLQRLGPLEVQCRDGFLLERSDRIEKGENAASSEKIAASRASVCAASAAVIRRGRG